MGRFTCVSVVIFSVFGIIYSHSTGTLHCGSVKDEFLKISDQDLVPDLPAIDEGLSVCSRSLTSRQATCCSKDSELVYLVASETYVLNNIRARNKFLKTVVTDHLQYYRETILELIHHTLNSTQAKLTDWYGIPAEEHRHIVNNLFTSFENFITSNHVIVQESVSNFFDHILSVIYKNVINRDSNSWTHSHSQCLTKHRSEINPQPFGKYPEEIANNLNHGLGLTKSYLDALAVILETINTTDNIALENECKHAVVRLQYCSHCRGFVKVKPCNGFCLDVMRGCLSNMAELGSEWNSIITSIEGLVREMGEKSLGDIFKKLSVGITDAIFNAVTSERNYYKSVEDLCGITIDGSSTPFTPDVSRSSIQTEVTGPLSMELMKATLNLIDAKGLYSNLADDICAERAKFEQNPQSGTCWNGTEISVYLRTPIDLDILEQARNNPEVKVTLVQPDLRHLKEKLTTVNQVLQAQTHKSERFRYKGSMISDDPIVLDFSGTDQTVGSVNIDGDTTLFDDEDMDGDYWSGSGSGTDEEVDPVIHTDEQPEIEVVLDKGNGGTYDVNQGGDLGPAPRTTSRPVPDRPPVNDKKSSVPGLRVSYLVLFIALYIVYVATGRR